MTRLEKLLMAASMAALCLITMANVVVRYFTDASFAFTEELSVSLLVIMTLIGASHAFAADHHIRITLLTARLPPKAAEAARLGACIAAIALFGLLAWYGALFAWDDWQLETTSPALGIAQWLYSAWLPLLSALLVLRLLAMLRHPPR